MANSEKIPMDHKMFQKVYTKWLDFVEKYKASKLGAMLTELTFFSGNFLRFLFLHPYTLIFIVLLQKLWLIFVVLFFAYSPLSSMDQAYDVFYSLLHENHWWQFWAYIAAFIFAITTWFTCRMLFIFFNLESLLERISESKNNETHKEFLTNLVRWGPPFIGTVPFIIFFKYVTENGQHFLYLFIEIIFYLSILSVNKDFIKMAPNDTTNNHSNDYLSLEEHPFNQLRIRYKILIFLGYVFFIGLFIVFAYFNLGISRHIGTLAVYFLGMSFWVYMAFTLLLLDNIHRAPITILSFIILLFLFNTNNHQIRLLEKNYFNKNQQQESLVIPEHFRNWLNFRKEKILAKKDKKYPVYIIATEGGGIRAAYWTVAVLGELSKRLPEFMDHTYAISGVSGGAVGASVFTALYHDNLFSKNSIKKEIDVSSLNIIGKDYLSPLLAAYLIPDMAQKISPVGINRYDRARYLEDALSDAYLKETKSSTLNTHFMGIWEGKKTYQVPSLFLNCTRVETGEKAIVTNLLIKNDKNFSSGENNKSVIDLQEDIARHISISTAAFMSARFPLITPPATVQYPNVDAEDRYNIVDGGYIDNSGLETALSILSSIRNSNKFDTLASFVELHLIMIKNSEQSENGVKASKGIYEIKAPLMAFFNSWDIHIVSKLNVAHEYLKLSAFNDKCKIGNEKKAALDSTLTVFEVNRKQKVIPLGWYLSNSAQSCLLEQKKQLGISFIHSKSYNKLLHFK